MSALHPLDAIEDRTRAVIDLGAIAANVATLRECAAPAAVWAVVKADGYGHGAIPVAQAALDGGADALCVALVSEAAELRRAGIDATILVLSEPDPAQAAAVVAHRLTSVVYSPDYIDALAAATATADAATTLPVHLKLDTGMHRVGAAPGDAVELARRILAAPGLALEGVLTHLAMADEPDDPYTAGQLAAFDEALVALRAAGIDPPLVHTANSAGALAHPAARHGVVRCGIAIYGIAPGPGVAHLCAGLRPALRWTARVSYVRRLGSGERVSYGLRHTLDADASIATVPVGYADGVPRRLHSVGGEVLIGGRRRPIVGVVTMDQLLADCGDDVVRTGDEVVLLGEQGDERVTPEEWGARLGTIGYEVVCGIGRRVPRQYR